MAEKIAFVRGDTKPNLIVSLTDSVTGAPIDLTGATVRLRFRKVGATVLSATLTGVVTNATGGVVTFTPADAPQMLTGPAGDYEGEVEITFADGSTQSVYDILKFKVREQF